MKALGKNTNKRIEGKGRNCCYKNFRLLFYFLSGTQQLSFSFITITFGNLEEVHSLFLKHIKWFKFF